MRFLRVVVAGVAMSFGVGVGCSFDDRGAGFDDQGDGHGGRWVGGPSHGGRIGSGYVDGSVPSDDANCGVATASLQMQPPEIMIVFDKSGSMDDDVMGNDCGNRTGCVTKWALTTGGTATVLNMTNSTVNWGLKLFPSNDQCGVNNNIDVQIAANNAAAVNRVIGNTSPGGRTPTRYAVQAAVTYLDTRNTPNPKFILLATDGLPNCANMSTADNANDPMGAVMAVRDAASAGYPTYVVGVATAGSNAHNTLNEMAVAGMRPRAGSPSYYSVNTEAELVTALSTIARSAATCTLALPTRPPDPANVGVRVDNMRVPRDPSHANGWDYGAGMQSIILYGQYCTNVMNMTYTDIRALFGCPGLIID
jgi:hypothetical protein